MVLPYEGHWKDNMMQGEGVTTNDIFDIDVYTILLTLFCTNVNKKVCMAQAKITSSNANNRANCRLNTSLS
jgi:hypothetical protein